MRSLLIFDITNYRCRLNQANMNTLMFWEQMKVNKTKESKLEVEPNMCLRQKGHDKMPASIYTTKMQEGN